jgi:hypothetical protein
MSFAKLDSGIVNSTLWVQPDDVLRVWIWMLSQADANGVVRVAAPALAMTCMKSVDRIREILVLLESPDPDSRSSEEEGRRIRKVSGGWQIINYRAYRERVSAAEKRANDRIRVAGKRAAARKVSPSVADSRVVSHPVADVAQAEAEAEVEAEEDQDQEQESAAPDGDALPVLANDPQSASSPSADRIPFQAIMEAYNATMTGLAKARELSPKRRALIRSAWQASTERRSMKFWQAYFDECQDDPFNNGAGPYRPPHENWRPTFDYLLRADVVTKIFEAAMDRMERGE